MAAAGQAFRLCVRSCRRISTTPRIAVTVPRASTRQFAQTQRRTFAASSTRRAPPNDEGNPDGEEGEEGVISAPRETLEEMMQRLKPEELKALEGVKKLDPSAQQMSLEQFLEREMSQDEEKHERLFTPQEWKQVAAEGRPNRTSFWYDEDDPTAPTEDMADEFDEDDMTPMAHGKLDEIREHRHYHRIMAWEMPLLSKLAKPFEPPQEDQILRFRYTTYMGEYHPAERKVVVQFSPADLKLSPVQADKLRKLAGPRYNPETDVIKMSSDKYEHQAQNKRYLSDLVDKLIATAKDPKDTFQDIPLDTRHHAFKNKPKFPKEWRMTEERRQQLDAFRLRALEIDAGKQESGHVVDGTEKIEQALATAEEQAGEKVAQLVGARGRGAGKQKAVRR
ncbi:37S ribosomal protein S24, mitochondrial [Colletotrichum spaethianum]|uniref:37S ribosomal protein S24, mitochondrial n=1 Tax=Colletotrichum spaethianum TaxID=700344 RepID=A0AA37UPM4_9PEZI|nr:37S ribosomal protein S24, mitochondrial [Colletotrichum spaethianum]GKT50955.1 37S ribosomal protein S24, mitochondrial [Colletotrichum spaethianum]